MEPQLIDYYNEIPHGINVIDKMNEELSEAQKEIEELKKNQKTEEQNKFMKRFQMPRIKVNSVEEYEEKQNKLSKFCEYIMNIIATHADVDDIISDLTNKLDDLTDNLNKAWCENRIITSIETYMNLKDHIPLDDIICGICDISPFINLSTIYFELFLFLFLFVSMTSINESINSFSKNYKSDIFARIFPSGSLIKIPVTSPGSRGLRLSLRINLAFRSS